MTITFNRFDLDYLFDQVSINYRYMDADGVVHNFVYDDGTATGPVDIAFNYAELNNALDPRGVREVSGVNNNLVGSNVGTYEPGYDPAVDNIEPGPFTVFGGADSPFLRTFESTYSGQAGEYGTSVDYDPNGEGGGTAETTGFVGTGDVGASLTDGSPRLIANLIASSVVDPDNPLFNPAALEAMQDEGGRFATYQDPQGNDVTHTINVPLQGLPGGG